MLVKPDLPDDQIIACLQEAYNLRVAQLDFLPLGADQHTAVYLATAENGTAYFAKLRRSPFNMVSATLPRFLRDQGISPVIAPLTTRQGLLWGNLEDFKILLFPYVNGRNGYEVEFSDDHWVELGATLRRVHAASVPPALASRIRREDFSPCWRKAVKEHLDRAKAGASGGELVAGELSRFLMAKRVEIIALVERADKLARELSATPLETVVCHSDIHAGNILIDTDLNLYIVDWDEPVWAPKERDLMFAGGGQFKHDRAPQEEESLFYQGYGETEVDHTALAYYRYERIIEDIAVECEQVFLKTVGQEDRKRACQYLKSNFLPNGTLEIARKMDRTATNMEAR